MVSKLLVQEQDGVLIYDLLCGALLQLLLHNHCSQVVVGAALSTEESRRVLQNYSA